MPRKPKTHTDDEVRDISEAIYRRTLETDCGKGTVDKMIEKDGDGGKKLRNRAGIYDRLTRLYLEELNDPAGPDNETRPDDRGPPPAMIQG